MMFLLAYIGAPPTIGLPAAMAPPATAKATTAAVLSNLIFIAAPFLLLPRGLGWSSANAANMCVTRPTADRMQLHASKSGLRGYSLLQWTESLHCRLLAS